jgi:hypothetical protein
MKKRPVGAEMFHADGHTVAFRNFAHAPKNHLRYTSSLPENDPSTPIPPVPAIPSHITHN